jgi:hypothetical protein
VVNMIVCFAGSGWPGLINGSCYLGQPGTVGPPPCRARVTIWARWAARHDTVKRLDSNEPCQVVLRLGQTVPLIWTSIA